MPRQFSLKGLLVLVVATGLGMAALAKPTEFVRETCNTIVLCMIAISLVMATCAHGPRQAFWISFGGVQLVYGLFAYSQVDLPWLNQPILTARLVDSLWNLTFAEHVKVVLAGDVGFAEQGRREFTQIGHTLIGFYVGWFAGSAAAYLKAKLQPVDRSSWQVSRRGLAVLGVVTALGIAGLFRPNEYTHEACSTIVFFAIVFAVVKASCTHGPQQAFWITFGAVQLVYGLFAYNQSFILWTRQPILTARLMDFFWGLTVSGGHELERFPDPSWGPFIQIGHGLIGFYAGWFAGWVAAYLRTKRKHAVASGPP